MCLYTPVGSLLEKQNRMEHGMGQEQGDEEAVQNSSSKHGRNEYSNFETKSECNLTFSELEINEMVE